MYAFLNTIPEICHLHGIKNVIISPGSRNAPLSIVFSRNEKFTCHVVSDERSAAFIGLGIAQASRTPVILICTSGSAGLNYLPAVSEAFMNKVPLLIFTADRPAELIGQLDGQAINQTNLYGNFVSKNYTFPYDLDNNDSKWYAQRMLNEAIHSIKTNSLPVHINFPFREPFYPNDEVELNEIEDLKYIEFSKNPLNEGINKSVFEEIQKFGKILIIPGQDDYSNEFAYALEELIKYGVVAAIDVISNVNQVKGAIRHHDIWLKLIEKQEDFKPDLIISTGRSIISKNLKLFLRSCSGTQHWHITEGSEIADTFKLLTKQIHCLPSYFLGEMAKVIKVNTNFKDLWLETDIKTNSVLHKSLELDKNFGEFAAVNQIQNNIFEGAIHLGNSLPVRYANYLNGFNENTSIHANRGTSGIDGSLSTAVGHASVNKIDNTVILGDISFFYDINSLWNSISKNNVRIIILNNSGGGIFRMIKGPTQFTDYEKVFEAKHSRNAKLIAKDYSLDYFPVYKSEELNLALLSTMDINNGSIIEVFSDSESNKRILDKIKEDIRKAITNL